ncbi:hypothetical protein GLOIN_2v229933 [Rhizophagus clarus]|nr:hypothetical protein GLOIN_2v229933 [Rhizophagus clarus]GES96823.1 hypothetical protein GLOIN_2v229933 [Rhizophagus clarus]
MPSDLEVLITELETRILKLEQDQAEREARFLKLEQDQAEREVKKNRKFQTRCIQIAKEILNEEPIIEYRPPFLNGLELDAFFQKYQIALEVQGTQHRLHNTSWYKDVKKLEDIVNRDRKKRCICQDKGISLLEVWYDEKPEIVIPKRIQKIKEFVCLVSKSFDIQTISYKTLTPGYLDWHAKLTGLPSILTDKLRSKLYKRYKKETGNEPWQLSEAVKQTSSL